MRSSPKSSADDNRWSDGPPLPRWALWLMLPGIAGPVLIFGFILMTQSAHDEKRCPYRELTRRSLSPDVSVLEESRSCVRDVEEHRYLVLRGGVRRLLGERRFDKQAFAPGHYSWSGKLMPPGEAQVVVHNDAHDDILFREGTEREHVEGISLGHRSAAQAHQAEEGAAGR